MLFNWIAGGEEKSHLLPGAASTSYTITGLLVNLAYKIQVAPVVGAVEGSPTLVTARTCESVRPRRARVTSRRALTCLFFLVDVPKVSSFNAVNVTDRSVVLTWTPAAGVSGYLLTWRHISGEARSDRLLDRIPSVAAVRRWMTAFVFFVVLDTKTEKLAAGFTLYKISDLLPDRTYIFAIQPLYGEVQGPVSTVYQKIREIISPSVCFCCTSSNRRRVDARRVCSVTSAVAFAPFQVP